MKDLAAERAVLAALCQYGLDVLSECGHLNIDHFSDNNQIWFSCIKDCLESGLEIDINILLSKAKDLGLDNIVSTKQEISYARSLFSLPVLESNIPYYYGKLLKLKIANDLKLTFAKCTEQIEGVTGDEDINDILGIIEKPFFDITSQIYEEKGNTELIGEEILDYVQYLIDNKGHIAGVPSPFKKYNEAIGGGHQRKCVDVIGARSKVGKSLIANATALHVAKAMNIPVLYLDTEMDKNDQRNRILANLANIPITDVKQGVFADDQILVQRMIQAAKDLEEIPYSYRNISGMSFDSILSIARKWLYQNVGFNEDGSTKDCLIIYDYMKLMTSDSISKSLQEFQVLGFQMTQLHNFAVKHDLPILTFVQLNRDGITKESTDVISGSDRILWLCTSFSIFSVKSEEEQADDRAKGMNRPFNRKLKPIVARHGGCLPEEGDYINIMMEGEYARLTEGPTRNNLEKHLKNLNKGFEVDNEPTDFASVK